VRIPLLAPLAAFALGVWTARLAALHSHHTFIAAVALIVVGLLSLRALSWRHGIAALLGAFSMLGVTLGSVESPSRPDRVNLVVQENRYDDMSVRLVGWVRRPPETLGNVERFVLEVDSVYRGEPVSGGILTTVYRRPEDPALELAYGTAVEFLARVRHPRNYGNPGAFDRVGWLAEQGIYLTATVRPRTPLLTSDEPRGGWLAARLWKLRGAARRRLDRLAVRAGLDGTPGAAIIAAMTLGDRRGLDAETRSRFERSGAYHVLVVSGMHVGLLAALVIGLVRATGLSIRIAWASGAAVAFGYALLLGADLPVSRAAWMLSAYLAASAVYRRRQSLNVISAVALAFLCWHPDWIADVGFQLSFLSVAAIAGIGAPLVERIVRPRQLALRDISNNDRDLRLPIEIVERRIVIRDWVEPLGRILRLPGEWGGRILLAPLRMFWASASIVLISSTITLVLVAPLAFHFQRLSLASPLTNLAVLPLLAVVAPVGFAALLSGWLLPYRVAVAAANVLAAAAEQAAQWQGLQYSPSPPSAIWIALALVACAWAGWALGRGRRHEWVSAITAVGCAAVIMLHPFAADLNVGHLELTAIDVGQGEALLLGMPDGRAGLVDSGGFPDFGNRGSSSFDVGERIVSPYLGSRGLQRLSFLAITHADADHVDGAVAVLKRFRPEQVWLPRRVLGRELRPLLDAAREGGVAVRFWADGESFAMGAVKVAASFCSNCPKRNDRSLVLAFEYGAHRFLLTGDIEAGGEQYLVDRWDGKPAAVLKIPHHGSRTSTSEALLEHTRPTIALVSAGYRNLYGHPHPEVLQRLKRRGTVLLRTDEGGASTVSSDGQQLTVSSERPLALVDF
jgi:competence protein ComEC